MVVLLALVRFALPRQTPNGILLFGLVFGSLNALLAAGLIVVYRSARVINFAQAALGGVGAALTFRLGAFFHWPFPLAFLAGIVASVAIAMLIDILLIRRFFNAPRLVLTVVTIVLGIGLAQASALADLLPGLPEATDPGFLSVMREGKLPAPFDGRSITIDPL